MTRTRQIVSLLATMALLLVVALATGAMAAPNDAASRADIVRSVCDAYIDVTDPTPAEIDAAFAVARDALGDDLFSDIDGVDLDGDGDVTLEDERTADCIALAQAIGAVEGYGDGTFGPEDSLRRAPTATIYAAALGIDVRDGTEDVKYDDVTDENVHGCNIHGLSDLNRNGDYNIQPLAEPRVEEPLVVQGYAPDDLDPVGDFGPWDDVTEQQVDRMTDRAVTVSQEPYTDQDYYPYEPLCDADSPSTPFIDVFERISEGEPKQAVDSAAEGS